MMIHNGELLEWIRMMSELQWIKLWETNGVEGNYAPENEHDSLKIDGWKIQFSFNGIVPFLGDMSIFMGKGAK